MVIFCIFKVLKECIPCFWRIDSERNKNMSIRIELNKDKVAEFCLRNHIRSLALLGSVLRDDFRPDSDVDVLIEFVPGQEHGLMELVGMQDELSEILGRKVDMVERKAVEKSENYIRRRHVLDSVEHVYVA